MLNKKRENTGRPHGAAAGTLRSVRNPGSGPAFELRVHENLKKTLSLSQFQFCHLQNGNRKLCFAQLTELREGIGKTRDIKMSES